MHRSFIMRDSISQGGIAYDHMRQEDSDVLASPTDVVNLDKKDGMRYDTKQSYDAPPPQS